MKFLVSRTSDLQRKSPPCSGAVFYGRAGSLIWIIELSDLESLMQFISGTTEASSSIPIQYFPGRRGYWD